MIASDLTARPKSALASSGRPRLSVSMVTRDSAHRLARVVGWARAYADEVVIGVDEGSTDDTLRVACDVADVVYRFRHDGQLSAVHMLPFEHCTGDWILRLDDDECMEDGFADILPALLADGLCTYYHFARKWLVSEQPPRYIHEAPWYPDYQARLIRNDRRIVWKPARYHSGYQVSGQPGIETRASILHFEPVWTSPQQRSGKPWRPLAELAQVMSWPAQRRARALRECRPPPDPVAAPLACVNRARIDPSQLPLHSPTVRDLPPWGCRFDLVEHLGRVQISQTLMVRVCVTNTGELSWSPQRALWPQLHVVGETPARTGMVFHAPWIPMPSVVHPGQAVELRGTFLAPDQPGDYTLSWDMDSWGECRFSACGSQPAQTRLVVRESEPPA